MSERAILITGGDGYLGRRLARHYLAATDAPLILWLRAADAAAFEAKRARLAAALGPDAERIDYYWGDLTAAEPFATLPYGAIDRIVHTAAVTRFNVDRDTAERVNIDGTRKLLQFAERCPRLERVALLSTLYVSGLTSGPIAEALFDGRDGFANYYEWSKCQAERLAAEAFAHLPWQIIRVATVIADDLSGAVTQQNAVHNTLKLFYYGLLALLPGERDTPLYFITGEFATRAVTALLARGAAQTIYHAAHRREESIALAALIDLVYDSFTADASFRNRRVLKPLFSDQEAFSLLAEGVKTFSDGVVHQAVSSVAPFARQLFIHKSVQNDRAVALLPDYSAPDAAVLMQRTCEALMTQVWKKGARVAHA